MNPFESYAKKATSIAKHHPAPLIGITKTRREAKLVYDEIVAEIRACEDEDTLLAYLASVPHQIAQFKAEMPFFWDGDGDDFLGIRGEIAAAREQFPANPESEAERIFGQFETGLG